MINTPTICSPGDVHNLWNKTTKDFRLVVFKINLPKEGEDSHWHEYPLAEGH